MEHMIHLIMIHVMSTITTINGYDSYYNGEWHGELITNTWATGVKLMVSRMLTRQHRWGMG